MRTLDNFRQTAKSQTYPRNLYKRDHSAVGCQTRINLTCRKQFTLSSIGESGLIFGTLELGSTSTAHPLYPLDNPPQHLKKWFASRLKPGSEPIIINRNVTFFFFTRSTISNASSAEGVLIRNEYPNPPTSSFVETTNPSDTIALKQKFLLPVPADFR